VKLASDMCIYGLKLKYATGDIHTLYEIDKGQWKTRNIPDGKEIIGLYGDFDESGEKIACLGFIVWEPNPFAIWLSYHAMPCLKEKAPLMMIISDLKMF
jgi:hypothetical protein